MTAISKKGRQVFQEKKRGVTPLVAAPGVTHPSDATALTTREAALYIISVLSVCLITFKSLNVGNLYSHIPCISGNKGIGGAVADWPTGKPGDFPVGPCFRNFFGPPAVSANLFH